MLAMRDRQDNKVLGTKSQMAVRKFKPMGAEKK
jgi:hypothetical protein